MSEFNKYLRPKYNRYRGLLIFSLNERTFCIELSNYTISINFKGAFSSHRDLTPDKPFIRENNNYMIINLHKYFGLKLKDLQDNSSIIFIEHNNIRIGFIVDEIREVLTVDNKFIYDSNYECENKDFYVKGLIRLKNKIHLVPDFDKIISSIYNQSR